MSCPRPLCRLDPAHPAATGRHVAPIRQCEESQESGPNPQGSEDGADGWDEDDFVPPEIDDPDRWDDFGADFDDEEPAPERGDFCTDDDPLDEER